VNNSWIHTSSYYCFKILSHGSSTNSICNSFATLSISEANGVEQKLKLRLQYLKVFKVHIKLLK
jgi:hypothetical protein